MAILCSWVLSKYKRVFCSILIWFKYLQDPVLYSHNKYVSSLWLMFSALIALFWRHIKEPADAKCTFLHMVKALFVCFVLFFSTLPFKSKYLNDPRLHSSIAILHQHSITKGEIHSRGLCTQGKCTEAAGFNEYLNFSSVDSDALFENFCYVHKKLNLKRAPGVLFIRYYKHGCRDGVTSSRGTVTPILRYFKNLPAG